MNAFLAKISAFLAGIITIFSPASYTAPTESSVPKPIYPVAKVATTTRPVGAILKIAEDKEIEPAPAPKLAPKKNPAIEARAKPSPPSPVQIKPKDLIPLEELHKRVRASIVNILCVTKTGGDLQPISGSGIIISKSGIILTNAHVVQYMLLKDYEIKDFISCVGRTGSPATTAYKIDLLYFPAQWLADNAKMIKQEHPEGTGENDFALLLITGSANGNPLPESFPFVEIETDQKNITGDVPVLLSGYPANFLGGIETQRDLWLTSSPSFLTKLYYFNDKENVDAFSVGSNILAQKGVSGGSSVNQWTGRLDGILTTVTQGATTGERDLMAISLAHIDRSFKKSTGESLGEFLNKDPVKSLSVFREKGLPSLIKTLTTAVESTSTPSQ